MFGVFCTVSCIEDEQPFFNPVHNQQVSGEDDPDDPNHGIDDSDINLDEWELIWEEDFEGTDLVELDKRWTFENNNGSASILCSRWRKNAELSGEGTVKLVAKHERKEGSNKDYTAASMYTKEMFKYGYFECRYRYAAVAATNNSFWLMRSSNGTFEIDVNEGHYPNKIGTNVHKWVGDHLTNSKSFTYNPSRESAYSHTFDVAAPLKTTKIRFSTDKDTRFQMREFRVYTNGAKGYPENLETNTVEREQELGITNLAKSASISVSGSYESALEKESSMLDDDPATWWSSNDEGDKWIVLEWNEEKTVGCVQFLNGWIDGTSFENLIDNYKLEYWNGSEWVEFVAVDMREEEKADDLSQFHVYGLEWNEDELIYYFDRKIIRRIKNEWCHESAPVWLSLAIISWAGPVVPADIDGKFMEVDYVRVYKQ